MATPALAFDNVSLAFAGDTLALDRVSLAVEAGKITSVVGPSGCGKTTLLRLASGLIPASAGHVSHQGKPVRGLNKDVGYVTQDSNLFPWLTARGNVEFPLLVRGMAKPERRDRAHHWLKLVGLEKFADFYPSQLSGGMQKRVAIVRTLIYEPEVILLDEPFGALDAQTRMALHRELLTLWEQQNQPCCSSPTISSKPLPSPTASSS
jgi:NitT/TauT family transport system ATP-binding protein